MLTLLCLVAVMTSFVESGGCQNDKPDGGCKHKHHNHGKKDNVQEASSLAKTNEIAWSHASTWDLPVGPILLSLCPPSSPDAAHQAFTFAILSTQESGIDGISTVTTERVTTLLNTFDAPRMVLSHGASIQVSNSSSLSPMLYRVSMSDSYKKAHDPSTPSTHNHSTHDGHHSTFETLDAMENTALLMACPNDQVSVSVTLTLESAGPYVLYSTPTLKTFATSLSRHGLLVNPSACGFGCDTVTPLSNDDDDELDLLTKWIYTLLGCAFASLTAVLGLGVLLFNKQFILLMVEYMTSFAAGSLLATVMFHIYPEAGEYLANEPAWKQAVCFMCGVLLGLLTEQGLHMYLARRGVKACCNVDALEELVDATDHSTHSTHTHASHQLVTTPKPVPVPSLAKLEQGQSAASALPLKVAEPVITLFDVSRVEPIAFVVGMGDFMHAFADGVLIAIAFQSGNVATGWLVTMAIVVHEVPHRIADFFIFLKAGMTIPQAICFNVVSSMSTTIGAILLLLFGSIRNATLGYMLAFGSGSLLFIAMADLMPCMMRQMDPIKAASNLACFGVGTLVIGLTMMNHQCQVPTE